MHDQDLLIIPRIRKRNCSTTPSPPTSSSTRIHHNYKFKRAIVMGHNRTHRVGGSRSTTPAPTWKMNPAYSAKLSAKESYAESNGGRSSRPVSARKLAATLWEMNELPRSDNAGGGKREKMRGVLSGSGRSGLHDPAHSPVTERMDRFGTGRHRKTSSNSQKVRLEDHHGEVYDSLSNASFMETESRSRAQTPSGSIVGVKTRLKDVSSALTTSKELLKIINRMWAHDNQPSSTTSLISALQTELERARLQVNQYIKEQQSGDSEINHLLKCFAEEKASWKLKEQHAVEVAIKTIAGELEVERKLRRRFESLNKKLGKELADTKASYMKAVKELESERRAREIMEQVCNELAMDIGEDRAEAEEIKRESVKVHEEAERERQMLQLADKLREERVQMKLSEAKHHFEEKNALVEKLRNQLEVFLGKGKDRKKGRDSPSLRCDEVFEKYISRNDLGFDANDEKDGEVENVEEYSGGESDLHSIELNMDNNNKGSKWTRAYDANYDSKRVSVDEIKARNSLSVKASKKSTSLQRSISDGVESGIQNQESFLAHRKSQGDEMQRYKSVKSLRDQILYGSRIGLTKESRIPEPSCQGIGSALRLKGEAHVARSKR